VGFPNPYLWYGALPTLGENFGSQGLVIINRYIIVLDVFFRQ
jgi:hypothetical protein